MLVLLLIRGKLRLRRDGVQRETPEAVCGPPLSACPLGEVGSSWNLTQCLAEGSATGWSAQMYAPLGTATARKGASPRTGC